MCRQGRQATGIGTGHASTKADRQLIAFGGLVTIPDLASCPVGSAAKTILQTLLYDFGCMCLRGPYIKSLFSPSAIKLSDQSRTGPRETLEIYPVTVPRNIDYDKTTTENAYRLLSMAIEINCPRYVTQFQDFPAKPRADIAKVAQLCCASEAIWKPCA